MLRKQTVEAQDLSVFQNQGHSAQNDVPDEEELLPGEVRCSVNRRKSCAGRYPIESQAQKAIARNLLLGVVRQRGGQSDDTAPINTPQPSELMR